MASSPFRRTSDEEPSDAYRARLRARLPRYPDEVLSQWHLQHGNVDQLWGWLEFETLDFAMQAWTLAKVAEQVRTLNEEATSSWAKDFNEGGITAASKLGIYMARVGTWPVPPIVLDNSSGLVLPKRNVALPRWCLLEGHHRLAYLRVLKSRNRALDEHRVWVARKRG